MVALVDDKDYERVMAARPWRAVKDRNTYYAMRRIRRADGRETTQYMHRFILHLTNPKQQADHENRWGLDNQRRNLRIVTNRRNHANQCKRIRYAFKGISFRKR